MYMKRFLHCIDKDDSAANKSESIICQFLSSFKERINYDIVQWMIMQNIADWELYVFNCLTGDASCVS